MLAEAMQRFQGAGYRYIGMDHFALENDALAVASREGRLHRNFQGYSTQPDRDLLGLGVSAIGAVGATYSQNAKTMEEYCDLLDQGRFPVTRGLALSRDDLARRAVIMAIMCQGQVWFESIELAWMLDFKAYFAAELERLRELEERRAGACFPTAGISVTPEAALCCARWPWCLTATCSPTSTAAAFRASFRRLEARATMSYALTTTALLMGLAGGPHCAVMCGAACGGWRRMGPQRRPQSPLVFQAGRLVGYSTAGAAAATAVQRLPG